MCKATLVRRMEDSCRISAALLPATSLHDGQDWLSHGLSLHLISPLVLAVHLLAMNLACVLPLHACWLASWERTRHEAERFSAKRLIWHGLLALVVGCLLGGVLYCWGDDLLKAAWARLPARAFWFALSELVFSAACLLVMIFLLGSRPLERESIEGQPTKKKTVLAWLLAVLSSTNLLYHFPPLMVVLGKLAANPGWSRLEELPRKELLVLMSEPEVIAMSVHFALASLAVASVYVLWLFAEHWTQEDSQASGKGLAGIALAVTLSQFGVGVWLLASLPGEARERLLGQDAIAAVAFAGGILGTLLLSGSLANIAFGKVSKVDCQKAALWTLVTVLLMTVTLSRSHWHDTISAEKEPRQKTTAALVND